MICAFFSIAREILGQAAIPFAATPFDKSPSSNWLVAWHQGTALPLVKKTEEPGWGPWSIKEGVNYARAPREALEQVLALRVHLDDSESASGPLRVIPETHYDGVLSDSEIRKRASTSQGVECTVARGGVIAMRPLITHASSKAENDSPRRVLHIEYASRIEMSNELGLATV
jgi:ectoine hydroxylase-related dioxygenase (phytanoyl-CoA dioxygenase family)